jgi:N-acylglucosamine 2-epimerase
MGSDPIQGSAVRYRSTLQEYTWSHYPVTSGEWTQWLDRYGRPTGTAALPVKDPFHLPRALITLIELLGPG